MSELEHEFMAEKEFSLKNNILDKWATLLGRRDNISKFIRAKELRTKEKAYNNFKTYYICKQESKLQEWKIL